MSMITTFLNGTRTINLNPASQLKEYRLSQEKRDSQRQEDLSKTWMLMEAMKNLTNSSKSKS